MGRLRGRLLAALALAVPLSAAAQELPVDWDGAWKRVEAALALPVGAPERRAEIESLRALESGAPECPERTLLEVALSLLEDRPAGLDAPGPGDPWPWDPEASWLVARLLPAGPDRGRALARALEPLAGEPEGAHALAGARLQLAWEGWLEAAQSLRFDEALGIGRPVHRDSRASWSALSLALSLTRAGEYDEADAVLEAQIEREASPAGLWSQRGISALGAGRERAGRGYLARALIRGSDDAGTVLARLDLAAGRSERARAGFRAALGARPVLPWARRGWGVTLLPPRAGPRGAPATSY